MSRRSCDSIVRILEKHYETVGVSIVNDTTDLEYMLLKRPDLVFLGMKYLPSPDYLSGKTSKLWLADYLDKHHLAYTGSRAAAMVLEYNKPLAKQVVRAAGLATADHCMAQVGQYAQASELPLAFPLFVKPPASGGGQGITANSVVRDFTAFSRQIQAIADEFHSAALVETYLPGREFSVAVLKTHVSEAPLVMPIELITDQNEHGDRVIGQAVKSADSEQAVPVHNETTRQLVSELASGVFGAVGARDFGRVDIRLDEHGRPHFLEINLIPSLIPNYGSFPKACLMNEAINYEAMILHITNLGLLRAEQKPLLPVHRPTKAAFFDTMAR